MHDVNLDAEPEPKELVAVTQSYIPEKVEVALSPLDLPTDIFRAGLERRGANRKALLEWVRAALLEEIDFGRIHVAKKSDCSKGKYCTNPAHFSKPSLWKPGAEKICGKLEALVRFPSLRDYEQAAVSGVAIDTIVLRCELMYAGHVVAEGVGARSVSKEYGDVNKAFKMAAKSAHIDATLRLAGLSEVFTQDLEDMVRDGTLEAPGAAEEDLTPALKASIAAVEARKAAGASGGSLVKVPAQAGEVGANPARDAAPVSPAVQAMLDEAAANRAKEQAKLDSRGPVDKAKLAAAGFKTSTEEGPEKCQKCGAAVEQYEAKAGHTYFQCKAARGNPATYDEGGHTYHRPKK